MGSCEINIIVLSDFITKDFSQFIVSESRLLLGSSIRIIGASLSNARAIAIFCFSSPGNLLLQFKEKDLTSEIDK
jgi:hypothetical protein